MKGSPSYGDGHVYIGSYDGKVYALDPATGRLVWRASSQAGSARADVLLDACRRLRPRVHRFDGRQGLLVRRPERRPPLVVQHRRLRVLLAGRLAPARPDRLVRRNVLRARRGHGRRALAVLVERPYLRLGDGAERDRLLLDLPQRTYALSARTGNPVWSLPHGTYAGAVADHRCLYVVGYSTVYAFATRATAPKDTCAKPAVAKAGTRR